MPVFFVKYHITEAHINKAPDTIDRCSICLGEPQVAGEEGWVAHDARTGWFGWIHSKMMGKKFVDPHHKECLKQWTSRNGVLPTCPSCRKEVNLSSLHTLYERVLMTLSAGQVDPITTAIKAIVYPVGVGALTKKFGAYPGLALGMLGIGSFEVLKNRHSFLVGEAAAIGSFIGGASPILSICFGITAIWMAKAGIRNEMGALFWGVFPYAGLLWWLEKNKSLDVYDLTVHLITMSAFMHVGNKMWNLANLIDRVTR